MAHLKLLNNSSMTSWCLLPHTIQQQDSLAWRLKQIAQMGMDITILCHSSMIQIKGAINTSHKALRVMPDTQPALCFLLQFFKYQFLYLFLCELHQRSDEWPFCFFLPFTLQLFIHMCLSGGCELSKGRTVLIYYLALFQGMYSLSML